MAMKKAHRHRPKAVEFYFNEKIPERPADRASRDVRRAPVAKARLAVEELLSRHHGAPDAEIRRLASREQKILFRIATEPSDRDHVYRREAVSALAALGSQDAVMLLSALASDKDEDPVITGRALRGLAKAGGDVACRLIVRALESHPDSFVRNCALKALLTLKHPDSVPALARVAETHPSPLLRNRVRDRLAEMGLAVKGKRARIERGKGVLQRERLR